jgi:hypothetical protein
MNGGGGGPLSTQTITPPVVITDPNALAFIAATGITDNTQKSAINSLVLSLKGYSIWDKLNVIYPFVGGTATTHKFNLKDPRDLDAAYRLSFSGGWTHNSNGITGNGTNAYASISNTIANTSYGAYTRTPTSNGGAIVAMVRFNDSDDPENPNPSTTGGYGLYNNYYLSVNQAIPLIYSGSIFDPPHIGLKSVVLSSGPALRGYENGSPGTLFEGYNFGPEFYAATTIPYIGARHYEQYTVSNVLYGSSIDSYSNDGIAFVYFSTTLLTNAEIANLYTAVQSYQTTLGRQV